MGVSHPSSEKEDVRYDLVGRPNLCGFAKNGHEINLRTREAVTLEYLETDFQLEIARHAPQAVFVHAGVVALKSQALVIPGPTYSGKTSLVRALLNCGATYLSDEFAVIDEKGQIHPYPRPLSLRLGKTRRRLKPPAPPELIYKMALVLDCRYQKGAIWRPQQFGPGEGVLKLFGNSVSARLTPERDLRFLSVAANNSRFYRSDRGNASTVAERILDLLAESAK